MFAMGLGNASRKDQRGEELSAASWSTPARRFRKRHADFFGITQVLLPGRDIGVIVSIELLAASFAAMVSSLKCLILLSQGSLWIQVIPETNVKQVYPFRVQILCRVTSQYDIESFSLQASLPSLVFPDRNKYCWVFPNHSCMIPDPCLF